MNREIGYSSLSYVSNPDAVGIKNMSQMTGLISEVFGSFQGEGPRLGERHVFVRFCRCNLKCAYCDTRYAHIKQPKARLELGAGKGIEAVPNPVPLERVVEAVLSQESMPGFNAALSITGGEPLVQPGFLGALLNKLSGRFKVLLETNGTLPEAFREVSGLVDMVSMDIKLPSVSGAGPLWDSHRAFLGLCTGKELVVKAVFSPSTPLDEVAAAARLVAETAPDALFVLQPLSPVKRGDLMFDYYGQAKVYLDRVRVIPQVHKIIGVK
jgi:7-carboxy-7-deazaguanine synthase